MADSTTHNYDSLQEPDESRPAKRVRLEGALEVTAETSNEMEGEDDWDDVYGNDSPARPEPDHSHTGVTSPVKHVDVADPVANATTSVLAPPNPSTQQQQKNEQDLPDGVPPEAISQGDDLVAPPTQPTLEPREDRVFEETTIVQEGPPISHDQVSTVEGASNAEAEPGSALKADSAAEDVPMLDTDGLLERPKVTEDVEFMAAAAAQKGKEDAEWRFDESDAESSSDSDTSSDDSSDDSDSGSDGGYELLDPATAAKILMSGDGDDDGEKNANKSNADHQPRTANEVKEEVVPKPDVTITPETKLTFLGVVERTVENMALIKGATPGEYQVLESGSVLCNEKREVIGTVADTFGRVQEPLYSVAFTNQKEIEEAGIEHNSKIFYVDSHSTFVFTQPLKNLKGTDASNIHDEEVNEDEMEFSDDEKEAEYKRQKKLAKKGGRAAFSRSEFNQGTTFGAAAPDSYQSFARSSDAPAQTYGGGGLSYDDDDAADGFYAPLKRPDNLDQLMSGGPPPPRPQQGFDRGRGRGRGDRGRGDRGRGRGDRGRVRGGFDQRRGGRGGHGHQQHQHQQGGMQSTPDRQNTYSQPNATQPSASPYQQYQTPSQYQPPAPSTYQFNGQTYQYNAQYGTPASHPQYYAQQPNPAGQMPTGAYVNPAFYQQQAQPPQQQQYAAWQGQYSQPYAGASSAPQPQASGQQGQVPDIQAILQSLGQPK